MFCITTLMKVPSPTGPKSHASGPELLLMLLLIVLLGGVAVCAEATGIKCGADTRTRIKGAIANSKLEQLAPHERTSAEASTLFPRLDT